MHPGAGSWSSRNGCEVQVVAELGEWASHTQGPSRAVPADLVTFVEVLLHTLGSSAASMIDIALLVHTVYDVLVDFLLSTA